jgi:hypothetical protein
MSIAPSGDGARCSHSGPARSRRPESLQSSRSVSTRPQAAGAPGSGTQSVRVLSRCCSARRSASRCGRKPESRWQSWQIATARWPRCTTSTQCGWQHWLSAAWWWSRRCAAAAAHAATSWAASPTGRCAFILSIAALFLSIPSPSQRLLHPPPSLPDATGGRPCSPLPFSSLSLLPHQGEKGPPGPCPAPDTGVELFPSRPLMAPPRGASTRRRGTRAAHKSRTCDRAVPVCPIRRPRRRPGGAHDRRCP